MKSTKNHNGDITIRIPRADIEHVWNLVREGKWRLKNGIDGYDSGFALGLMRDLDHVKCSNYWLKPDGTQRPVGSRDANI